MKVQKDGGSLELKLNCNESPPRKSSTDQAGFLNCAQSRKLNVYIYRTRPQWRQYCNSWKIFTNLTGFLTLAQCGDLQLWLVTGLMGHNSRSLIELGALCAVHLIFSFTLWAQVINIMARNTSTNYYRSDNWLLRNCHINRSFYSMTRHSENAETVTVL